MTKPVIGDKVTFDTGAERGTDGTSGYTMLSQIALRRYAAAMAEGAIKYKPHNWRKGHPAENLLDHVYTHLAAFLEGDSSEDHLGHALWNLATLVHWSEANPSLFDSLPPGVKDGMLVWLQSTDEGSNRDDSVPQPINAEMDEHAAKNHLGHWKCIDPKGNAIWERRADGLRVEPFEDGWLGTYGEKLRQADMQHPLPSREELTGPEVKFGGKSVSFASQEVKDAFVAEVAAHPIGMTSDGSVNCPACGKSVPSDTFHGCKELQSYKWPDAKQARIDELSTALREAKRWNEVHLREKRELVKERNALQKKLDQLQTWTVVTAPCPQLAAWLETTQRQSHVEHGREAAPWVAAWGGCTVPTGPMTHSREGFRAGWDAAFEHLIELCMKFSPVKKNPS